MPQLHGNTFYSQLCYCVICFYLYRNCFWTRPYSAHSWNCTVQTHKRCGRWHGCVWNRRSIQKVMHARLNISTSNIKYPWRGCHQGMASIGLWSTGAWKLRHNILRNWNVDFWVQVTLTCDPPTSTFMTFFSCEIAPTTAIYICSLHLRWDMTQTLCMIPKEETHRWNSPVYSCWLNCTHLCHITLHFVVISAHYKIIFAVHHVWEIGKWYTECVLFSYWTFVLS